MSNNAPASMQQAHSTQALPTLDLTGIIVSSDDATSTLYNARHPLILLPHH